MESGFPTTGRGELMLTGVESMYFTYFRQAFTPTENCWRRGDYEKVGPSSEAKRVQWKRPSSKAPDAVAELG